MEMSIEKVSSWKVWLSPWSHLKWPRGWGRSHLSPAKQVCQGPWEQVNRSQVHRKTSPGTAWGGSSCQEAQIPWLLLAPFHGKLGLFGNLLPHNAWALACLLNRPKHTNADVICSHVFCLEVAWPVHVVASPGSHGICFCQVHCCAFNRQDEWCWCGPIVMTITSWGADNWMLMEQEALFTYICHFI